MTPALQAIRQAIQDQITTNHNGEITGAILNPILVGMLTALVDSIGDIEHLNTENKDDLVSAVNELHALIQTLEPIKKFTGVGDPNLNPPTGANIGDLYYQMDGGVVVDVWQFIEIRWVSLDTSVFVRKAGENLVSSDFTLKSKVGNSEGSVKLNGFNFSVTSKDSDEGWNSSFLYNAEEGLFMSFGDGNSSIYIHPDEIGGGGAYNFRLGFPNTHGNLHFIPVSVNGEYADADGNIEISEVGGDYLKKDESNEVTEDFEITNGDQTIKFDGDYSVQFENHYDGSVVNVGSNEGSILTRVLGGTRFEIWEGLIYYYNPHHLGSSWRIEKDYSDTERSDLLLPQTESNYRRLALSVNNEFADEYGNITLSEVGNALMKDESNTVTNEFDITNGDQTIRLNGADDVEIETDDWRVNIGSSSGYSVFKYIKDAHSVGLSVEGLSGENLQFYQWSITKNPNDVADSHLHLPSTGSTARRIAISVNNEYADENGNIELDYISETEKGQPDGVATLDADGHIPIDQLPTKAMTIEGEWDASTNTPLLEDGIGNDGMVYVCQTAGTVDFGNGDYEFKVGDWAVYGANGKWFRAKNSNEVTSVNGKRGDVILNASDVGALSDSDPRIANWNTAYNYANTQRVLTLNETLGSIKIDNGVAGILTGLGILDKPDAHSRGNSIGLTTIYNTTGSVNYPDTGGGGLRFNRHSSTANSSGFEMWTSSRPNQDVYFRKFWSNDGEGDWKIIADKDWVTSQIPTDDIQKGTDAYRRLAVYELDALVLDGDFDEELFDVCPTDLDTSFISWDITWVDNGEHCSVKQEYFTKGDDPLRLSSAGACLSILGNTHKEISIPAGAKLILNYA